MTPIELSLADLTIAALSLILGSLLSIVLSLNVHRSLMISAIRMIAQLVLIGFMLRYVFFLSSPILTLFIIGAMILAATFEVQSRQRGHFSGWMRFGAGALPVTIATVFVSALAMTTALSSDAWLDPRHVIPLTGIILGTAMNSTSLALNSVLSSIASESNAIEARLSLGADRHLALREIKAQAARNGLIPVINQMAGAGIITLPGIMTGQILAGMDPLDAAKYQILLMFLLAGAGVIGVIVALELCVAAITDERHRLRLDRLEI